MPPNETTSLLSQTAPVVPPKPFSERFLNFVKATEQPTWLQSYRFFFFGSWLNVLLVFVPLSIIGNALNLDAGLQFAFSFFAIVPLAGLLGTATEEMSAELGQTLAGLLNASFGNAVEIIVGIAALLQGELRIVQTSMLGSILSNILLVLGCSFLAAGFKFRESHFQMTAAQTSSSLMTLACITLVIPAAYHSAKSGFGEQSRSNHTTNGTLTDISSSISTWGSTLSSWMLPDGELDPVDMEGLLILSRGTAILLLGVYVCYLWFQLKTHSYLFEAETRDGETPEVPEAAHMSTVAAASALLAVTVTTSFCADYLVASIEETAERYDIPKPFIGLILLPIVANAAEHVTSVWMALKNKMEITIGVCVGSSIQVASFVIPLLVIIGWITGHELTLFFANFETIVLFVSVLLVNLLIQDGKSNYMEGLMLLTLYAVIALAFWVA